MDLKSSEPFWLIKNGLVRSYPSIHEDISADVLIVGGGITGSLIAHQCVKDGYKTVLIDKREICNGSTSATTSMLQYEIDVPLHELIEKVGKEGAIKSYVACYKAIDTIGELVKEIKSKSGFKKKESLYFASKEEDVEMLKREYEVRKKATFEVEWLEKEEIEIRYGLMNTFGGILSKQGASVDAFCLAHDLLYYNQKQGLTVMDKTELVDTEYKKKEVIAKTSYGNRIVSKKVIYCNGYESTQMIKEKFVKLLSSFAMVSEQDSKLFKNLKNTLIWNTEDPYLYMRTTDDGRVLVGGQDLRFKNTLLREKVLPRQTKKLEEEINKYFPDFEYRIDFSWAGTFGETKDGLPYIGEHPDFPLSYWVLGFGGNGITFSVAGMQMVSAFLKGKEHDLSKWFQFGR